MLFFAVKEAADMDRGCNVLKQASENSSRETRQFRFLFVWVGLTANDNRHNKEHLKGTILERRGGLKFKLF